MTRAFTHAIVEIDMHRKFAVVFSWFILTPIVIVLLLVLSSQNSKIISLLDVGPSVAQTSTSNELDGQVLGIQITDMRPYYIANFLKNTRLEPYSHYIVKVSDKYNLDYRLIPAIAMKESGGGNAVKEYTHNAWGWENGRTVFPSWEVAIDTVGKTLKEKYADRGLVTPDEIMPVYAPPQIYTGGKWAKDVNHFFEKLQSL